MRFEAPIRSQIDRGIQTKNENVFHFRILLNDGIRFN